MKRGAIIDTGPLVAILNRNDEYHAWSVDQLKGISGSLLTCESVISEAFFLLRKTRNGADQLEIMLTKGVIIVEFSLHQELKHVCKLLSKYRNVPMSLTDACMVRMAEIHSKHRIFTLDSDFHIYRQNRNRPISVVIPDDR